jgi:probable F420-dependent oxidoreductase
VTHRFRFGLVSNDVQTAAQWRSLARRAEALGYSTLLSGDHLGQQAALARAVAAAAVTSTLRVGSYVTNVSFQPPLRLAQEAATVADLTGGRLELGLGTGWSRPEFALLGVPYQDPAARAAALEAAITVMKRAWAGEITLTQGGREVRAVPPPVRTPPLLIGGYGDAILSVAARHADIVALTSALKDGEGWQTASASARAVADRIRFARAAAAGRAGELEISVCPGVIVTEAAAAVTAKVAAIRDVPPQLVAESPFALIGSCGELAGRVCALRERLGISYVVVPAEAADDFAPVVAKLAGR